jgi:predicted small metal-binding protein
MGCDFMSLAKRIRDVRKILKYHERYVHLKGDEDEVNRLYMAIADDYLGLSLRNDADLSGSQAIREEAFTIIERGFAYARDLENHEWLGYTLFNMAMMNNDLDMLDDAIKHRMQNYENKKGRYRDSQYPGYELLYALKKKHEISGGLESEIAGLEEELADDMHFTVS